MSDPKLAGYAELLRRWAPKLDLIADADLPRLRERHIADSLRLRPLVAAAPVGLAIDVGSGAGLPGVPLAIVDPGRIWRLLEPRQRRAAFLEEVIRELELGNCEVVVKSAQVAARDPALARGHALATARALAPPRQAFKLMEPLVYSGGSCLCFVGESADLPAQADEPQPGIARLVVPASAEGPG